ncbi:hypothetical protein AQJ84_19725 [Streptomyces resistomycificus]|nr:hypothetical protein AQJ84_19725 [Streptomyces resistomycificus]
MQKSGLTGQATELDGAGDDAGKIRKAVEPAACYTQDTLGGPDSGAAFNAYAAAWSAEARTIEDALHELADKIRLSKGAYTGSDGLVETSVRSVRTGDGSLTTGPARADAHVSTMPAFAERPSALTGY